VGSANIHNVAIEGTFDDCQDLVKGMFADSRFRERHRLAAVNSINWARVAAQTVYYFTSASQIAGPSQPMSFCVPTGNFGNIFAGFIASQMGLPVERLVIASNHNDILTRTHSSGVMQIEEVQPSTSPAMDIQVSSNFERLLFELSNKDGRWLRAAMQTFRSQRELELESSVLSKFRENFDAGSATEDEVDLTIKDYYLANGDFVDPHTAVGLSVIKQMTSLPGPMAVMSTAHPAKFDEIVKRATGSAPSQPEEIAVLNDLEEKCTELPNDLSSVMDFVAKAVS